MRKELTRGTWYFDMLDRELVYLAALDDHFVPDSQSRKQVRFRLVLSYGEIRWRGIKGIPSWQHQGLD